MIPWIIGGLIVVYLLSGKDKMVQAIFDKYNWQPESWDSNSFNPKRKTVILRSGHSRERDGVYREHLYTLEIAQLVKRNIEGFCNVIITDRKRYEEFSEEVKICDELIMQSAGGFSIQLHINSGTENSTGTLSFYYDNNKYGKRIAESISKHIHHYSGIGFNYNSTGSTYASNPDYQDTSIYPMVKAGDTTDVLTELFFNSNPLENRKYRAPEKQEMIAYSIAQAIKEVL